MMTLTHLPTRASVYASQPLGFVSAAEGFVFLSAFVAGSGYSQMLRDRGTWETRRRAWTRAAKLYGCHVGLLLFTVTIAAAFALYTERPALSNLLSVYFSEPAWATLGGPVLLYQPPLLDILPMYVVFIAITPSVLQIAKNLGWMTLGSVSLALWLIAQLGAGTVVHEGLYFATGWPLPIEALGAFDWFAWQLLWIVGLWFGAYSREFGKSPLAILNRPYSLIAAPGGAILFFAWRHQLLGDWVGLGDEFRALDKWHLGPLRLINFTALAILISTVGLPIFGYLRIRLLSLLGQASLPVFMTHLLICIPSLGLIVDDTIPLSLTQEIGVLTVALASMLFVASRAVPRQGHQDERKLFAEPMKEV